ncbi:MAG: SMI1/KNR4 family protein [Aquihabitans sp.]
MADGSGLAEGLHRLELALAGLGVDLAADAAPSATDAQLAAADDAIGFRLPDDVRTLYRWHDGGRDRFAENARSPKLAVAPGWYLISLDRAVEDHLLHVELLEETDPDLFGPGAFEHPDRIQQLFPLFQSVTGETLDAFIDPARPGPPGVELNWEATVLPVEKPGMGSIGELIDVFAASAASGEVVQGHLGELEYVDGWGPSRLRQLRRL